MKTERRRHYDSTPRATYAAETVAGNCELVRFGSDAYKYMLHQGFVQLDVEGESALMKCPPGWGAGSVLA